MSLGREIKLKPCCAIKDNSSHHFSGVNERWNVQPGPSPISRETLESYEAILQRLVWGALWAPEGGTAWSCLAMPHLAYHILFLCPRHHRPSHGLEEMRWTEFVDCVHYLTDMCCLTNSHNFSTRHYLLDDMKSGEVKLFSQGHKAGVREHSIPDGLDEDLPCPLYQGGTRTLNVWAIFFLHAPVWNHTTTYSSHWHTKA